MAELGTIALTLLLMAAAGVLAIRLALPPAIGYVAAGVAAGALIPDHLPDHILASIAEVGVIALLFFIGLELDLKRLRSALRETAWVTPFDLAVPGLMVAAAARLAGWSFKEALALGMALAISSTIFGDKLTSGPAADRRARRRVLGTLVSEDVAAAGLIALIVVLAGGDGWTAPLAAIGTLLFFFVLLTAAALLLVPRIMDEVARRHVPEVLALWSAGLVVLWGYLGFLAGSAELGALVAGVAAAEAGSRYVVRNTLAGIRDVAAAVFFLVSGLAVEAVAVWQAMPLVLTVGALFAIGKLWVHIPAGIASGLGIRAAGQGAVALATVGEFSLILAAVAASEGVAHPQMHTVAVGVMVLLLPLAVLGMRAVPAAERRFWKLPPRLRRPLVWMGQSLRGKPATRPDQQAWTSSLRMLAVNALLLAAWGWLAAWSFARVEPYLTGFPVPALAIWAGVGVGIGMPMLVGAYRAYRSLVRELVGLREGEREGAGKVRARLVDALVTVAFFLILLLAALRFPRTAPFVAGAALVAIIVGALAWRQLSRFHRTLEAALGRVLGHDADSARLLDQVLDRYPWGVKFAAVVVPPGSPVARQTLLESRIGDLSGALVAVLQRGRREVVNPEPGEVLRAGDTLVLLGDAHQLARAEALVVAHGQAIRMTAQSKDAAVEELTIDPSSPWAGKDLESIDVRHHTGTLVIGVWPADRKHPQPYRHDTVLRPGDRLIVLGTPLQVHRARIICEGIPQAG